MADEEEEYPVLSLDAEIPPNANVIEEHNSTDDGVSVTTKDVGKIVPNTNFTAIKIIEADRQSLPRLGFNLEGLATPDFDELAPVVGLDMETGDIQYFYKDGVSALFARANLLLKVKVFKNLTTPDLQMQEGKTFITRSGIRVYCHRKVNEFKYRVVKDNAFSREIAKDIPEFSGYEVWYNGMTVSPEGYIPSFLFNQTNQTLYLDPSTSFLSKALLTSWTTVKVSFYKDSSLPMAGNSTTEVLEYNAADFLSSDRNVSLKKLDSKFIGLTPKISLGDLECAVKIFYFNTDLRKYEILRYYQPSDVIDFWNSPETRVFFAKAKLNFVSPSAAVPVNIANNKIVNWEFRTDKFSVEDQTKLLKEEKAIRTPENPSALAGKLFEVQMRKIDSGDQTLPQFRLSENT